MAFVSCRGVTTQRCGVEDGIPFVLHSIGIVFVLFYCILLVLCYLSLSTEVLGQVRVAITIVRLVTVQDYVLAGLSYLHFAIVRHHVLL